MRGVPPLARIPRGRDGPGSAPRRLYCPPMSSVRPPSPSLRPAPAVAPRSEAAGFLPPASVPLPGTQRGALLWDFILTFVGARQAFLGVYRHYERRVKAAARQRGVPREELRLPPGALWRLFHGRRLEFLLEHRLVPLRDLARQIFGQNGDDGLMDAYCAHIFHEVSVLAEEHRSVGRFLRHEDPRRYRDLFDEVSKYYPTRLRRVKRFFEDGRLRLEELLRSWSGRKVVIRSVYVFGAQVARRAWQEGRPAFYRHMYPQGGAAEGYWTAARCFGESGFDALEREALGLAVEAGRPRGRRPRVAEREAAAQAARRLAELRAGAESASEARGASA